MRCIVLLITAIVCAAVPAAAQERPFLFSIATTTPERTPALRFDYDVGAGERGFQSDVASRPEQRLGVQATRGRLMLLARFGMSDVGSSYQSSQSGELLYALAGLGSAVALAGGGGVLHEPGGTNILVGRVAAGHSATSWLLHGNLIFHKPLSSGRDELDVVTTIGWARKLTPAVSLGAEMVGEDLEGFWAPQESEGGARLLLGPSLRISPAGRRWQLIATGGPLFHPSDSGRSSAAFRDLPPDTRSGSYVFKTSLSVSLTPGR